MSETNITVQSSNSVRVVPGAGGGGTVTWANVLNKPTGFTPEAHIHGTGDISGLATAIGAGGGINLGSISGTPMMHSGLVVKEKNSDVLILSKSGHIPDGGYSYESFISGNLTGTPMFRISKYGSYIHGNDFETYSDSSARGYVFIKDLDKQVPYYQYNYSENLIEISQSGWGKVASISEHCSVDPYGNNYSQTEWFYRDTSLGINNTITIRSNKLSQSNGYFHQTNYGYRTIISPALSADLGLGCFYMFDTSEADQGANLFSVRNSGSEKFSVGNSGLITSSGGYVAKVNSSTPYLFRGETVGANIFLVGSSGDISGCNFARRQVKVSQSVYTARANDSIIFCNAATGDILVILPNPSGNTREYDVKKIDHNATGVVTISGAGGTNITIDGYRMIQMSGRNVSYTLVAGETTGYYII